MEMEGRTTLVTGASKNIGRAIAVKLAEQGADVGVVAHNNREGCEETARYVQEAGGKTAIALGDLGAPGAVEEMINKIRSELGPIDTLVNNATYRPIKPLLDLTVDDIDRAMNVNFRGNLLTAQHVIPDMLDHGGGSIVNVIGAMVYLGRPNHAHSYGTKFAIEGLTRQLASEFGRDGVRVNAVSPGLIEVGRDQTDEWEQTKEAILEATPLGRIGTVDEIANVCSFLASDRASFITGQVIHANGGTYPIPRILPDHS